MLISNKKVCLDGSTYFCFVSVFLPASEKSRAASFLCQRGVYSFSVFVRNTDRLWGDVV
ncbi:hypothetical protein [Anaeromicropila populeti]|uniref:hypothetical protein n=1 Tax=Anaeromicropila populeti TaxID=37658 RepID=UPI001A9A60A4|nr:hypothetical protein [Anaeromicropila populeti]